MEIEFLKVAENELDDAFKYYELQYAGLGYRFQKEVSNSLSRMIDFPFSYEEIGKYSRRCLVQKFPYGVIYQYKEENNKILVVAVAHLHRKPDFWFSREN